MGGRWVEEFEGWWEPVDGSPSPRLHGKVEWERDGEGHSEIDVLVRKLDLPDGSTVEVVCDGQVVISCPVEKGRTRTRINTADGARVANLSHKAVELRSGDQVLARTVVEPD